MTYNFDPDRWYDNEYAAIEGRHRRGELSDADLTAARENLFRRYQEMLDRLDGTYQIPKI